MATITPGRLQIAGDSTITNTTTPMTLYTVPSGLVLYLDYFYAYFYNGTFTGTPFIQFIIDQGAGLPSCSFLRFYKQDQFTAITFSKPQIVTANLTLTVAGGGTANYSTFWSFGGECV